MTTKQDVRRRRFRITRRGFLIGAGVTGLGVAVGVRFGVPAARLAIADFLEEGSPPGGVSGPPDAWIEIEPDGPVRLYVTKAEMGQGIHTAMARIAAEELELDPSALEVVSAPTSRALSDAFGTGGSTSVSSVFTPLREAAAIVREALVTAAAASWNVPSSDVFAMDGRVVRRDDPSVSRSYGQVVATAGTLDVDRDPPPLKDRREYKVVGRNGPRVDLPRKLDGQGGYGIDARMPGMRYGAVARPPVLGAVLASARPGTAMQVPGVTHVVIEDGFAGVVANRRSAAHAGVAALDLTWNPPDVPVTQREIDDATTVRGRGTTVQRDGNVSRRLAAGVTVTSSFRTAMAAHAHLEPQSAVVEVTPSGVRALVATQNVAAVRGGLADLLDRKEDEIDVTATWLGGGFGRRLNVAVASEAARLARAAGVPVHVVWTREEEFRHGYLRPPTHSVLEARLVDGVVDAWRHRQASGDVAFPFFPAAAATVLGADFGAWRGARSPYGRKGSREVVAERVKLRVPTGWWRGLGLMPNVFATESFMDELAAAAGADPVAFRLAHLGDDDIGRRLAQVLRTAADHVGWPVAAPDGVGYGVAISEDVGTCVAQIAEVQRTPNGPKITKIVAAVDPGLIVHPDGVVAQTEGSIVWGISSVLHEAVIIEDGRVRPANFDRYPIARASDVPDIEVVLVEGDDAPHGVGEPPMGPVAAAVANAWVAAGGERPRTLPFRLA